MSENEFERKKVCYEQNCENFRSLNKIMWQVPIIAMTLTGGLGYGLERLSNVGEFKTDLLIFAGIANVVFVIVLFRLRYVMEELLEKMELFETGNARSSKSYIVVSIFSALLLLSSYEMFSLAHDGNSQSFSNQAGVTGYITDTVSKDDCD